jgi:uncharacterized Zn-binding protein involved in type VI secretion
MPLVARGNGVDSVNTGHPVCAAPGTIATLSCSGNVFVHSIGVHRKGDTNTPHTHCPPVYSTTISTYSPNVFVNNLNVARLGDSYTCSAYIQAVSQGDVFANS